jgi:hypothetical protein
VTGPLNLVPRPRTVTPPPPSSASSASSAAPHQIAKRRAVQPTRPPTHCSYQQGNLSDQQGCTALSATIPIPTPKPNVAKGGNRRKLGACHVGRQFDHQRNVSSTSEQPCPMFRPGRSSSRLVECCAQLVHRPTPIGLSATLSWQGSPLSGKFHTQTPSPMPCGSERHHNEDVLAAILQAMIQIRWR